MKPYFPAIIWLIVIAIISGYPGEYIPKVPVWQYDKLVHSLVYAILSFLLLITYYKQYEQSNNRFKLCAVVVVFSIFYGGFMEFLQNTIFINRSGNWYDFIANVIGAFVGVLIFPLMIKFLPINRWFKIK